MLVQLILYFILAPTYCYQIVSVGLSDTSIRSLESYIASENSNLILVIFPTYKEYLFSDLIVDLLLVYSQNELNQESIIFHSNSARIPTIIFGSGASTDYIFFTQQNEDCISDSILSVINHLEINRIGVILLASQRNLKIYELLNQKTTSLFENVKFLENVNQDEITLAINKVFKIKGVQNYLFLTSDKCDVFFNAFETSKLNYEGNVGIFTEKCIYDVNLNDSIILTESFLLESQDEEGYYTALIQKFLSVLNQKGLDNTQIADRMKNILEICSISIVNVQGNNKKVVGNIFNRILTINETIYTYGGLQDRSNFTKPMLKISAYTGTQNPPGYSPVFANSKYQQGTYFAVDKINKDHQYFPDYTLALYDKIDCGVSVFDYNYSKYCYLNHRKNMGLGYIPPMYASVPQTLSQIMQLNLSIPCVGGVGSSGLLTLKSQYPYFVRIASPSVNFAVAWSNLISIYEWEKIVVIASNDSFGISAYTTIKNAGLIYNYEIINDENKRIFDNIMNNSTIKSYYGVIQDIIDLGCNIIFLAMGDPTPFFWLEGFYDLGARRGDFTFIFFTITGLDAYNSPTGNMMKRKELMHGSFVMYNAAWVGDYGQKMRQEMLKAWPIVWGRSYFIDTVYSFAETIEFLLNQGKDYQDIDVFMNALRGIRFVGATGTISFDVDSNNRNMYFYNVFNFYEDSDGVWHDDAIALISPLGSVYYNILKEAVWPSGVQPTAMKELYENCPFRKDQIRDSDTGLSIKVGVSLGILVISSGLTIYALKKMKFRKINMIKEKAIIVFSDYMVLGFIIIEALQLLAIGPSFSSFNKFLSNISEMLSLNLSKATNFKDTTFWIVFWSMTTLSYAWLLLLLISFLRLCRCFRIIPQNIDLIKEYSIPIVSNFMFLPIIVSLISILMCDKASGTKLTDAYLNYDCNLSCWEDNHIIFTVLACFLIIVYIPIAILYRTLWQEENKFINIRTNSVYLILKNISVVILVIIGKILKNDYELTHGLLFICIEIVMLIIILVIRTPFNYDRANLWCKIMKICVIWNAFVCILGNNVEYEAYASVVLQLLGWLSIIVFGFVLQNKLGPNMLVSVRGRSIVELFRFAFGIESYRKSVYVDDNGEELNLCEEGSGFDMSNINK